MNNCNAGMANAYPGDRPFIGVKMIWAQPAGRLEAAEMLGKSQLAYETNDPGYIVTYPDGYRSWSPKDAFEKAYLPLSEPTRITVEDILNFMGEPKIQKIDQKTTLVSYKTRTGFVQHEASSCVDPANYNEEIGERVARDRVLNKLWPCFGFVLQWARNGLK